ncbi:hypothetical protein V6N11_001396 [Hibiscus sabdariffa]|uniref:Uncharacterized protein n=1 Tax=Hibiscus sabdariffa TaxID=183260 RepID=A0ABR2RZJ5_9ROSI
MNPFWNLQVRNNLLVGIDLIPFRFRGMEICTPNGEQTTWVIIVVTRVGAKENIQGRNVLNVWERCRLKVKYKFGPVPIPVLQNIIIYPSLIVNVHQKGFETN